LEYAFIEQDGDDEQQEDSFVTIYTTKPLPSGPTISTQQASSNDGNEKEKEASMSNAE